MEGGVLQTRQLLRAYAPEDAPGGYKVAVKSGGKHQFRSAKGPRHQRKSAPNPQWHGEGCLFWHVNTGALCAILMVNNNMN